MSPPKVILLITSQNVVFSGTLLPMESLDNKSERSEESRITLDLRSALFIILAGIIVGGSCGQLIKNGADREPPSKESRVIKQISNQKK